MEIAKKVLAVTLALMSAFTTVNAESVKSDKPTDSSISAKDEESTGKKLAKGAVITVGVVAIAAAVGKIFSLIRNIPETETRETEENLMWFDFSYKIFEWYLDPEIRFVVKKYEDTELGKSLTYLFNVLDKAEGVEVTGSLIEKHLCCVYRFTKRFSRETECMELRNFLNERHCEIMACDYYGPKCIDMNCFKEERGLVLQDRCGIRLNACIDCTKHVENFMKFSCSNKISYSLEAIIVCDEKNYTFVYVKEEDGRWHRRSFDGLEDVLDDKEIKYIFEELSVNVNLIYKICSTS